MTGFSHVQIGTAKGQRALHHPEVLTSQALAELAPDRRAKRVGRALAAILAPYWQRFSWTPAVIRLMGGNGVDLPVAALEAAFRAEVARRDDLTEARAHWAAGRAAEPLLAGFSSYAEQSAAHLEGAAMCATLLSTTYGPNGEYQGIHIHSA